MKESEAWWQIGAKIERNGLDGTGLCYEADVFAFELDRALYRRLTDRINAHLVLQDPSKEHGRAHMAPHGDAGSRILGAYFLALECEDEERGP